MLNIFYVLVAVCRSSLVKGLFMPFVHFPPRLSVFFLLISQCSRREPLVKCVCYKDLPFFSLYFHSLDSISWCIDQKLFILMQSNLSGFFFFSFISCLRRLFLPWGHGDTLLCYVLVALCFPIYINNPPGIDSCVWCDIGI